MMLLNMKNIIGLCLLVALTHADCDQGWNYIRSDPVQGPDAWSTGTCKNSTMGSPINIVSSLGVPTPKKAWNLVNFDKPQTYTVANEAQSPSFTPDSEPMTVSGGGLPGTFRFAHMHFHWGPNNSVGSEHSIDGKFYPLEIHLSLYNDRYPDINTAFTSGETNALAVLTFFAKIGTQRNADWAEIIYGVGEVKQAVGMKSQVTLPPLTSIFPQLETGNYARYEGGFTTPGCLENINWTLFERFVMLSYYQVELFRWVNTGRCGTELYRPLQPLNGRTISYFS